MTENTIRAVPAPGEAPDTGRATSAVNPPHAPDLEGQHGDASAPGDASARDKAKNVAASASDKAGSVLDEARSGASDVKEEAREQARGLWDQARSELSGQAGAQQQRLADALRSFGEQLGQMASAPAEPGLAGHLARGAGDRASTIGDWLENHDPEDVLDELRSFARRRPGAFLLAAAGAGLLVGRLTRAAKDAPPEPAPASGHRESVDVASGADADQRSAETPPAPVSTSSSTPSTSGAFAGGGL